MSFAVNDPEAQPRVAAFENGLRQLGWVTGHNFSIEYRWADNPDVFASGSALTGSCWSYCGATMESLIAKEAAARLDGELTALRSRPWWRRLAAS